MASTAFRNILQSTGCRQILLSAQPTASTSLQKTTTPLLGDLLNARLSSWAGLQLLAVPSPTSDCGGLVQVPRRTKFGTRVHKKVVYVQKPKKLPEYRFHHAKIPELTGGKYTHKPLPVPRLGGRSPETGIKVNQHIGGGIKWDYFLTDDHRVGPTDGSFYEEKVLEIKKDPNRTPFICLVAGTKGRRWLEAVHGVKEGQIIRTSSFISVNPVKPSIGDAYPVGALPAGTEVCCIEFYPGRGASMVRKAAGSYGVVLRRQGDYSIVRLPSKQEISIKKECMVTVGRLSNPEHSKEQIGSPNEARRRGIKQSSGLWHRKTGYCGRKIRPLPPLKQYTEPHAARPERVKLTLTKQDLSGMFGPGRINYWIHH